MDGLQKLEKYDGDFDETKFIVGIDIGNNSAALSYFNFNSGKAEQIDISGGYGKPSVPAVVQYIKDTGEWVFGEYALMNKPLSDSVTFENLIDGLGEKKYYTVGKKALRHSYILSLFIREVLGNIKNINPNSEIIGIAVSISYMSDEAEKELFSAFCEAGYKDLIIGFFPSRECILNTLSFGKEKDEETILSLDFGDREIRGELYSFYKNENDAAIKNISTFFESDLGTGKIEKSVYDMFERYFIEFTEEDSVSKLHKMQLEAFTYQHKDLIFKSRNRFKLYFNFAFPPFQKIIETDEIEAFQKGLRKRFEKFLSDVFGKDDCTTQMLRYTDIDRVVCFGGGFEMPWARRAVSENFENAEVAFYKNSKGALAEGACLTAARILGAAEGRNIAVFDSSSLTDDIGIFVKEKDGDRFIPFIEKNFFWWHKFKSRKVIINQKSDYTAEIEIFKRDRDGRIALIDSIVLHDIPKRPKGTNCFEILFEHESSDRIAVKIADDGFGEFFHKTDYKEEFIITVK